MIERDEYIRGFADGILSLTRIEDGVLRVLDFDNIDAVMDDRMKGSHHFRPPTTRPRYCQYCKQYAEPDSLYCKDHSFFGGNSGDSLQDKSLPSGNGTE